MPSSGKDQLNISVDAQIKQQFKELAKQHGTNATTLIINWINQYIESEQTNLTQPNTNLGNEIEELKNQLEPRLEAIEQVLWGNGNLPDRAEEAYNNYQSLEHQLSQIQDELKRVENQVLTQSWVEQQIKDAIAPIRETVDNIAETANATTSGDSEGDDDSGGSLSSNVSPAEGEGGSEGIHDSKDSDSNSNQELYQWQSRNELAKKLGISGKSLSEFVSRNRNGRDHFQFHFQGFHLEVRGKYKKAQWRVVPQ